LHNSIRDIAQHNINLASAYKTLKKINKIHIVQELSDDDFDRRIEFCDLMIDRIIRDPQFQNNIAFLDEVTFPLTSEINRQNDRYWNNENLH